MINITKEELQQLSILKLSDTTHNNGGNVFVLDNVLYKIFKEFYSYQSEIERNTDFQIKENIPNTPKIFDKIYVDGKFSGYVLEYIKNSKTFREAIGKNIEEGLKLKAICDVYKGLKYLHKRNIYLGDVHSDNFLISNDGNGYIIDLDYMRFPGDEYKFQQCYLIKPNNKAYKINIASIYTDNIKVMLSCLSLLIGVDLERFISKRTSDINLEEIYNNVIYPLNIKYLDDYFDKLMNREEVEYFSDYLLKFKEKQIKKHK